VLVGFEVLGAEMRDVLIVRRCIEWDGEAEGHVGLVSGVVEQEDDVRMV
jgi:hypothetical protein